MSRGKNMKGEHALEIAEDLGIPLSKSERAIFSALVDDTKKMEDRMTALEKTVSDVQSDVKEIKHSVKELSKQVSLVINEKQSFLRFLNALITEKKFWIWLIILTLLIFGVTESDLLKFLK